MVHAMHAAVTGCRGSSLDVTGLQGHSQRLTPPYSSRLQLGGRTIPCVSMTTVTHGVIFLVSLVAC